MTRDAFLTYKTPEETGVASANITDFILDLGEHDMNIHSFILMKDGAVITEAYYKPFDENTKHRMYSMTKSFTALAIGLLQDEGKLNIHDKIVSYFPEYVKGEVDPYMADATIRDLLMMSSPQSYTTYNKDDPNFVETFFTTKPSHAPGTIFSYDTSASDVLAALVDKLAGKPMLEYMKDRMLREMGFSEDSYTIRTPEGGSSGGSGLLCTPRDLAKVGQMLLDGGKWKGKQLLSEAYVREATAKQEDNNFTWQVADVTASRGYGYFIWRTYKNSYSFLGMGEQFVTVIPDKNMVFIATSDNQYSASSSSMIMQMLYRHIVDKVEDGPVPVDTIERDTLDTLIADLSIPVPNGEDTSPRMQEWSGVTYKMEENTMGITSMRFTFGENEGRWEFDTTRGKRAIPFGYGAYAEGDIEETQYYGRQFGKPGGKPYHETTAGVWVRENHLMLRLQILEQHIGNATLQFVFSDDGRVSVYGVAQAEWFLREYDGMMMGRRVD